MEKLKKEMGVFSLISLGVGAIIGSGIFIMPAIMGAIAGPALIVGILIAGIIACFLALPFAEMGSAFPKEGGPYAFPRMALGDFSGFMIGWGYFLYLFIGTAATIDIFVVYSSYYFPSFSVGGVLTPLGIVVALIALWVFTLINILGVRWGSLYNVITTIGKMIPLAIFAIVGFFYFQKENFSSFFPFGFSGVTLATTLFFWSYTGFEAVVVPSEEIRNPRKTIPISLIVSLATVILVYVVIALCFVGLIDWQALGTTPGNWKQIGALSAPLSDVASAKGLLFLAAIGTIGAIVATAGSGGSWVLIQSRFPYAMAKDQLFWDKLEKIHPRFLTPVNSLLFTSILTSLVIIAIPSFPSVALMASVTSVITYVGTAIALPIMRKRDRTTVRPFKLPFYKTFTLIAFILGTYVVYWGGWPWTLVGGILIFLGYPFYLLVKAKKEPFKKILWLLVYLLGITLISFIGDPKLVVNNFTGIDPLGWLFFPTDLAVLGLFAAGVYFAILRKFTNR